MEPTTHDSGASASVSAKKAVVQLELEAMHAPLLPGGTSTDWWKVERGNKHQRSGGSGGIFVCATRLRRRRQHPERPDRGRKQRKEEEQEERETPPRRTSRYNSKRCQEIEEIEKKEKREGDTACNIKAESKSRKSEREKEHDIKKHKSERETDPLAKWHHEHTISRDTRAKEKETGLQNSTTSAQYQEIQERKRKEAGLQNGTTSAQYQETQERKRKRPACKMAPRAHTSTAMMLGESTILYGPTHVSSVVECLATANEK